MFDIEIWKAYYYMYINPNLNCGDLDRAFIHYMTSGRHNGNFLFDWKFYVQRNALPYRSLETALEHYLKNGILKNFVTHNLKSLDDVVNSFFDWKYYIQTYSLNSITSRYAAIEHWKCKGKSSGFKYNAYMGTLPQNNTIVKNTEYINDTRNNIVIRHDNTVTIKNVGYAITNVLRDTYSTLLQRILLLKIALIRVSSDLSFRRITYRQRTEINTYINEIEHVIKNTRYADKLLFVEDKSQENTIEIVSDNTNISIHEDSKYNYNRSMDFLLYVRETPAFLALEAGQRSVFNSTWKETQNRMNTNRNLIKELNGEIALYKDYISKTLTQLEHKLDLVNKIFNNFKLLLPGYGEERIGNDKLINILEKQFELYKMRHLEFIKYLKDDKNSQCYTSLQNTLEISTTPLNNIIVDLNDLNNTCSGGLIGNVVFSIDNLESTLDMYRNTNAETVENIHKNRDIVKKTRTIVTELLKNYTNRDLSADLIVKNYNKLKEWVFGLETELNNSTSLASKNSIISNITKLFTNIRIRSSVTDEIVTEHLRLETRQHNIDELSSSIHTAIDYLKRQLKIINELQPILEKISEQSAIVLHNDIFTKDLFTWECRIEALDRIQTCTSDINLGRHILRLPFGIAIDIKDFNPIEYGINKPIIIRATKPKWRSVDIYCSDRIQYSIGIDNMNLNITDNTIRLNNFEDIQNSIRTTDNAVEQLVVNLKHLRDSHPRV